MAKEYTSTNSRIFATKYLANLYFSIRIPRKTKWSIPEKKGSDIG